VVCDASHTKVTRRQFEGLFVAGLGVVINLRADMDFSLSIRTVRMHG
jgi:hypothetical protein